VKRLADILLPDGSGIDENKLGQIPDINPDQTSKDSLGYVNDEVASYQGGQASYIANPTVAAFQKGLMALGYTLPQFGADGKFGPETENQVKHFQQDYQIEASAGKIDRTTAKMMVKALQYKNIQNMGDVENALNAA
jgi:peptidoglycan hydrolase-like protein with peptidoglycan-binding domain